MYYRYRKRKQQDILPTAKQPSDVPSPKPSPKPSIENISIESTGIILDPQNLLVHTHFSTSDHC